MTFRFETYKSDMERKIFLKSIVNGNAENITQKFIKNDNGFVHYLFWQTAKYCGISDDID